MNCQHLVRILLREVCTFLATPRNHRQSFAGPPAQLRHQVVAPGQDGTRGQDFFSFLTPLGKNRRNFLFAPLQLSCSFFFFHHYVFLFFLLFFIAKVDQVFWAKIGLAKVGLAQVGHSQIEPSIKP